MTAATTRRQWLLLGSAGMASLLAACSTPPRTTASASPHFWSGRMALQLEDDATHLGPQTPQSFSASFELEGDPQTGSLQLFSPLGSSVAWIRWQPGSAELLQGNAKRVSDSLDLLLRDTLGTPIPVPALFDWIQGTPQAVEGWHVDLSQFADGRIAATRHTPPPQARLRLILDR